MLVAVVIGHRLPGRDGSRSAVGAHGDEHHQALRCIGEDPVLHGPGAHGHQNVHAAAIGMTSRAVASTRFPTINGREN